MGTALSSSALNAASEVDQELVSEYRDAKFADVCECRDTFLELYGAFQMTLDAEQFDECFGLMLADTEEHFQLFDNTGRGQVDVFEVFCAALLFCQEQPPDGFAKKVDALFDLFDTDNSDSLNPSELTMLLMAGCRGLAKLAGLPNPSLTSLETLTAGAFEEVDADGSGAISRDELKAWVEAQPDISSYMAQFVGSKSILVLRRLFHTRLDAVREGFRRQADAAGSASDAAVRELLAGIEGSPATDAEIDELVALMDASDGDGGGSDGLVSADVFFYAVKPWVAFSIVDDDASGQLDASELKFLIWLESGREPPPLAVSNGLASMDEDGSGQVGRMEWVAYATVINKETGALSFNDRVKKLFDEHDEDGSGSINYRELEGIIASSLHGIIDGSNVLDPNVRKAAFEATQGIAQELIARMDASGNGIVEWDEFKAHMDALEGKLDEFRAFITAMTS